MKTPRVTDFDPDAKVPNLKSSLDNMPAIQRPKQITPLREASVPVSEPTGRPPDEETGRHPNQVTGKRVLVRRGFEWYEDQLSALKKLSLNEQIEGRPGSMSKMVREALDDYLQKRAAEK